MTNSTTTNYSNELGTIVGNASGAVETLLRAGQIGGKRRSTVATIVFSSQATATVIGVSRLPLGATLLNLGITIDTSLGGTATIGFGDSSNGTLFAPQSGYTTTDRKIDILRTSAVGMLLSTGYDCTTGLAAPYEDIVMTVAAAALPSSGTLKVVTEFALDN